jgi:RHS repeat-associated protein
VIYRYDGQMWTEDYETNPGGTAKSLTRFGLGARGVDVVSRTTSSGSQVSYPLYDGHGNNVSSLLKNGASFTVADEKTYDAWGGFRSGGGANKGKYCASIGHKQDDESGLVYMRARYYEPTSGRFVSADRKHDGHNWFVYGHNNPTNMVDRDGGIALIPAAFLIGFFVAFFATMFNDMMTNGTYSIDFGKCLVAGIIGGCVGAALASGAVFVLSLPGGTGIGAVLSAMSTCAEGVSFAQILGATVAGGLLTAVITKMFEGVMKAVGAVFARNAEIMMMLALDE